MAGMGLLERFVVIGAFSRGLRGGSVQAVEDEPRGAFPATVGGGAALPPSSEFSKSSSESNPSVISMMFAQTAAQQQNAYE
jgi:hypothetical protein